MEIEILKILLKATETEGISIHTTYSGRGMYGKNCVGISGYEKDIREVFKEVLQEAYETGEEIHSITKDDLAEIFGGMPSDYQEEKEGEIDFETLLDLVFDYKKDNMGMGFIYYWPSINAKEFIGGGDER